MRIGVITFWQSNDNYGQLLQCWALQQYLRSIGHEAYIIKYDLSNRGALMKTPLWKKILKVFLIYPIFQHIKRKDISRQYKEIEKKNIMRHFDDFRKKHLHFSEYTYKSLKELQRNPPQADMYIAGSDQVWNPSLKEKENEVFFLNFGNKDVKRISYAASFGFDVYLEQEMSDLQRNLKRFNDISVREDSGVEICKKAGYKAIKVLDPTLLLNSKYYLGLRSNRNHSKPYIYIYSLNITSSEDIYFSEIKQYSKEEKLDVIVTPATGRTLGKEYFGSDVEYDYVTIPEWLSNISNANLVITTSFHGIAFSLKLHANFVYVPLKNKHKGMNSRITDLLGSLNLHNRVMEAPNQFKDIIKSPIDWNAVDSLLGRAKQISKEFLFHSCK